MLAFFSFGYVIYPLAFIPSHSMDLVNEGTFCNFLAANAALINAFIAKTFAP